MSILSQLRQKFFAPLRRHLVPLGVPVA